ncbi:hypothetical protein GWI33_011547 [Rhynchophorus ferrugineus]|uniref:Uncharacterized protein n=1 Tax=Rhynchophorus ferrugineus TaxID=354439 RepID=A0A834MM10_RHYFE|nr:hypothetical protein GWI33_011547 [Rhynchophorus ferrugineus]
MPLAGNGIKKGPGALNRISYLEELEELGGMFSAAPRTPGLWPPRPPSLSVSFVALSLRLYESVTSLP